MIFYGNWHLIVNKTWNLSFIIKLLVENIVFKYYLDWKTNKTKFIDLYICGSRVIITEKQLNIYQYKAKSNWQLRSVLDDRIFIAKEEKSFNINALKEKNIFYFYNKTNKNSVNK